MTEVRNTRAHVNPARAVGELFTPTLPTYLGSAQLSKFNIILTYMALYSAITRMLRVGDIRVTYSHSTASGFMSSASKNTFMQVRSRISIDYACMYKLIMLGQPCTDLPSIIIILSRT